MQIAFPHPDQLKNLQVQSVYASDLQPSISQGLPNGCQITPGKT